MTQQPCPILAATPPLLRPWVWLQLFFIQRWVDRHQRAVFLVMDTAFRVHIRFLGDAPKPANTYTYEAPRTPAWKRADPHAHLSQKPEPPVTPVTPEFAQQISGTQRKLQPPLHLNPG